MVDKLRKLLLAMDTANSLDQLDRFPGWRLHPLKGELKGCWNLRRVTGNWRMIFEYDVAGNTAWCRVDFNRLPRQVTRSTGGTTMAMKNPPHPGELIRTEIIDALGLNVSQAAEVPQGAPVRRFPTC